MSVSGFCPSLVQAICLSGARTQVEVASWQIQAAAALTHHSTQPRLARSTNNLNISGNWQLGNLAELPSTIPLEGGSHHSLFAINISAEQNYFSAPPSIDAEKENKQGMCRKIGRQIGR